jgi:hypothetical protein
VPVREVGLLAGHALALLVVFAQQPVCAQSGVRPTIRVAPAVSAEATSQVAFAIAVGPAEAVPPLSFIRLRGLPPMAALSDAYWIAPGVWAVALASLPSLKIIVPAGVSGRSQIVITLVALDGTVLAEAKSVLAVAPPREQQIQRRAPAPPSAATMLRAGTPMAPPDRERAQRVMKKGDQELEDGNVSAARLLYENAADAGLAQAAMALAATFDPSELAKLKVRGIAPDAKQARRWYERALQLGAAEAEQRLRQLGAQ